MKKNWPKILLITWDAMRAHLLPYLAWSWRMSLSSSGVRAPFFKLGWRWLAHRSLQLLPQRLSLEFLLKEFQFPSPYFLTQSIRTWSSAVVHGPFFRARLLPSINPPLSDGLPSILSTAPPLTPSMFCAMMRIEPPSQYHPQGQINLNLTFPYYLSERNLRNLHLI